MTPNGRSPKTLLESLVHDGIRSEIATAIRDHLRAHRPALHKAVSAALNGKLDKLAMSVVDAFANEDWRADLTVKVDTKDA